MKKYAMLFFLLVGLLVLAACGGGDKKEEAAGGVDTSSFKSISDPALGITLDYPDGWVNQQVEGAIQLATSQELFDNPGDVAEGAIMLVTGFEKEMIGFIGGDEVNVDDPVSLVTMFKDLMMEGEEDATVREEAKAVTLNNNPAAQMIIDAKADDGRDLYGQLTAVPNGDVIIFLFAVTPKAQESDMRPLFDAMYGTMKLSTPNPAAAAAAEVAVVADEPAPEPTATAVPTNTPAPTATPKPTEAPDVTADFTETAADEIGFAISHPDGWVSEVDSSGNLRLATDLALLGNSVGMETGMALQVSNLPLDALAFILPAGTDPKDPVAVLEAFVGLITGSGEGDSTFTEREAAAATKIAGYDAATVLYEVTGSELDGLVKFVTIADPQNNRVVFLFAATTLVDQAQFLPILDAMLETVTLSTPTTPAAGFGLPTGDISGDTVSQWASRATASTQYSNPSWAASQATGAPNTPECGDHSTAWASASSNGVDWLELTYDEPVYATQINIHQSYNPDQVVMVELITPEGEAVTVYEMTPFDFSHSCPYMLPIFASGNTVAIGVRIHIDQSVLGLGWNEIDAVELIGFPVE